MSDPHPRPGNWTPYRIFVQLFGWYPYLECLVLQPIIEKAWKFVKDEHRRWRESMS